MISISKKFLFIHLPKTGGNSIQQVLKAYSEDEITTKLDHHDGIEEFGVHNKEYRSYKHSTLSHYKKMMDIDIYKSLFKFTTIRNPWDRMISYYFSPHRGVKEWDRAAFIEAISQRPLLRNYIMTPSITEKINQKIGLKLFTNSKRLGSEMDYIIRYENLNQDFSEVCRQLQIPFSKLSHRNKSSRQHYSYYYDDELIEIVMEKFEEEIELGEYTFQFH